MRHRDKETVLEALQDWRELRKKVATEGGENYVKPVLVKFLDTGTFEVMDRDIVEDEFYVLRERKILREFSADGRDLENAIRDAGRDRGQRPQGRDQRRPQQGQSQRGDQRDGRHKDGGQREGGQREGSQRGDRRGSRRGRRRGRRTGRRGPRPPREGGGPPPASS